MSGLQTVSARSSSSPPACACAAERDHRPRAAGARFRNTSNRGEGHHTEALLADYPLQLISPHPRFSFHTMGDAKEFLDDDIKDPRIRKEDGRHYWIIRLQPRGRASPRGRRGRPGAALQTAGLRSSSRLRSPSVSRPDRAFLRVVRRLRSSRPCRRVSGPGRLREHPYRQAVHHPHLHGHGNIPASSRWRGGRVPCRRRSGVCRRSASRRSDALIHRARVDGISVTFHNVATMILVSAGHT